MAEFTVTAAEMEKKAEEVGALNADLQSKASELTQIVLSLDSIWEGDAHDAFKTAYSKAQTALDKYSAAILKYSNALSEIAVDYDKTEAANTSIAQS